MFAIVNLGISAKDCGWNFAKSQVHLNKKNNIKLNENITFCLFHAIHTFYRDMPTQSDES